MPGSSPGKAKGKVPRPSPRVGAPSVVAQPEADEVAAAGGLGVVFELGAAVAEGAVVDELDFARRELEIGRDVGFLENLQGRGERGGAFIVERRAAHRVAAVDLVDAEARAQLLAFL